jgi:hypothetical protein
MVKKQCKTRWKIYEVYKNCIL